MPAGTSTPRRTRRSGRIARDDWPHGSLLTRAASPSRPTPAPAGAERIGTRLVGVPITCLALDGGECKRPEAFADALEGLPARQ